MQICEREDIATNISAWVYRQSGKVWKKLGKTRPAACGRVFTGSIFGEGVHFLPTPPLCSLLFVPCVANPCCYCPTLAGLGQHWGGSKPSFAPIVNFLRPGSTIVHSMSKDKGTVSQVRRHPQDKEAVWDGGGLHREVKMLSEMLPKYVFPFYKPFLKKSLTPETVINKGTIYTASQNLPVTL